MNNSSDLITIIQNNHYKFSKGQKMIAKFLTEHYDKAAFMTASKIGEAVDVSESTVVRFAAALGFDGFPELQEALQVLIKNKLTTVQRMGLEDDLNVDTEKFHKKIIRNEMNEMKNLLDNLDSNALERATEIIHNAKRVFILGMRTSSTLANYLGFYLDVMHDNVKILNNTGVNSLFEQIVRVKEDDVLICICFPRYSNITIDAAKMFTEKNAKVIAITDTEASPIYNIADVSLLAKNNIVSFVDSLVVPMCLIINLILNIGIKERHDLVQYFDDLEGLWDKHSIYQQDKD